MGWKTFPISTKKLVCPPQWLQSMRKYILFCYIHRQIENIAKKYDFLWFLTHANACMLMCLVEQPPNVMYTYTTCRSESSLNFVIEFLRVFVRTYVLLMTTYREHSYRITIQDESSTDPQVFCHFHIQIKPNKSNKVNFLSEMYFWLCQFHFCMVKRNAI